MSPVRTPSANSLLASLPKREYERLRPHLEPAPLVLRAVLHEASEPVSHVWFPKSGVLSFIASAGPESTGIEVGLVGREGMAGLSVFLGAPAALTRCVVQVPGEALRLGAAQFRAAVAPGCALNALLLRYTHAFLAQVSQSVACNALHPVEKRLCRWLLMMHGRAGAECFPLTHEFLAAMLGVRRATVTVAARKLLQAGLIRYARGEVTVLDRPGLEQTACPCHRQADADQN